MPSDDLPEWAMEEAGKSAYNDVQREHFARRLLAAYRRGYEDAVRLAPEEDEEIGE